MPGKVIDRAVQFLLRCQNADGGFRYRLIDPPESLFPRSAAAVVSLCAAGLKNHSAVERGRSYLAAPPSSPEPIDAEYYYYGRFYGAHAAWQQRGTAWEQWFPRIRDELLHEQTASGCWTDDNIGNEYATAMALLILQVPSGSLPLFTL